MVPGVIARHFFVVALHAGPAGKGKEREGQGAGADRLKDRPPSHDLYRQSECVIKVRMRRPQEACMKKRATNLSIDHALLDEARGLGISLSATFEASLRDAVRTRKAARWLEENRAALQSSNEWVEKHGLPLEKYRQF